MFVWAVRDKGSEWRAIKAFLQSGALPFTPLVEAVCEPFMTQPGRPGAAAHGGDGLKLSHNVAQLTDSGRLWVDLCHLERIFSSGDVAEMHRVFRQNPDLAVHLAVPVARTSAGQPVIDAAIEWARAQSSGLCIRVDGLTHLRDKSNLVSDIVAASGLSEGSIDLILDAQDLPLAVSHDEMRNVFPVVHAARTWVVLAGTFPRSITDMDPNDYEHKRERGEWLTWREEIERVGDWRRPVFGDYATQPAVYNPSAAFPGSPSVRYSTGEQYVILRGRGGHGDTGADFSQFIGHARYLREQPYFRDVIETSGDRYVERIATDGNGTGNLV